MVRPSLHATPPQRALGRNLGIDLFAAVGVGTTVALVSALLPTIGRRGGLEPIGLAALAAAPFVANLLSAFAGRVGPRTPRQLAAIRGAGAASLLVLAVATAAPVLILVSLVYWLSLSLSGPFQLRLWGAMYPPRLRGRIVGAIGSGKAVPTVPTHAVDNYVVRSTSKTGNAFTITKSNTGSVVRSCTATSKYGCPSSGSW